MHPAFRIVGAAPGGAFLRPMRQVEQDGEILLGKGFHARTLHLHHDASPVVEHGGMHLTDGGGSHRGAFERPKHLVGRASQFLFYVGGYLLVRDRGSVILQAGELGHVVGREQIGARAEDLAQLDERNAQLFQRHPEVLGLGIGPGASGMMQQAAVEREQPAQTQFQHQPAQTVPGERPDDPAHAPAMLERGTPVHGASRSGVGARSGEAQPAPEFPAGYPDAGAPLSARAARRAPERACLFVRPGAVPGLPSHR